MREGVQVPRFTPIFTIVAFKMWAYGPKFAKMADFWYKFWPRGVFPQKPSSIQRYHNCFENYTAS